MMSITHPLPTQSLYTKKRVPVVLQSEAAECGLACMTMIAQYYSDKRDLNALRQTMSVSLRGTTLKDVMRIASDLGFQTRAIKIEMEHLAQLSCPAILHWNMNHFVVLTKVKGKNLTHVETRNVTRPIPIDVPVPITTMPRRSPGISHRATWTPAKSGSKAVKKAAGNS